MLLVLTKERGGNLHVFNISHLVQIILGILMVMISWNYLKQLYMELRDGYIWRILWFKLSSSNHPKVIANYYLCCIKELNLIPHVVRGDHGTENVIAWGIQRFLRRNHTDSQSKDKSFIYGHSTANQRIESWWSQLFKSMTSWWITFFKDMVVNGLFDISLNLHLQCLRFFFFFWCITT